MRPAIFSQLYLSCILLTLFACPTNAQQPTGLTVENILLQQRQFFFKVDSLEYVEEKGSLGSGIYQQIIWKELANMYAFTYTNLDKDNNSEKKLTVSYDGHTAFECLPIDDLMNIQKQPFTRDNDYLGSLRGPLYAYEFMRTKGTRIDLEVLTSAIFLRSLLQRATLCADYKRVWSGHPCITVKISGGFNGVLNREVSYIAYFATDLGLYPIAWQAFTNDGHLLASYWVKHFQTIPVPGTTTAFFRYPDIAVFRNEGILKLIGYQYPPLTPPENVSLKNVDSTVVFSGMRLNNLTKDDFTLDPSMAGRINDLDSGTYITVPK
jgi:hypothetical protein